MLWGLGYLCKASPHPQRNLTDDQLSQNKQHWPSKYSYEHSSNPVTRPCLQLLPPYMEDTFVWMYSSQDHSCGLPVVKSKNYGSCIQFLAMFICTKISETFLSSQVPAPIKELLYFFPLPLWSRENNSRTVFLNGECTRTCLEMENCSICYYHVLSKDFR